MNLKLGDQTMTHALIIDDDPGNIGVLQQLLTLEAVTYTAVQDSSQLGQLLPGMEHIDIVFLDLEMPDVNGYEVFELLKSQPRLATVPIVACTVYSEEIHRAREMGFHSFISKPLDADRFVVQLESILQQKPVWNG
jgi:CheY-like chemotaxis protein